MKYYCYNCMQYKYFEGVCEHCGCEHIDNACAHHIAMGTVLNNRYLIGRVIGEGGFGITYVGRDLNLDMLVAVKEFYPNGYAYRNNELTAEITVSGRVNIDFFENGKSRFINEARALAKFSGNKNIVDVRDYFEENNTAYIVMEYVNGKTLKDCLKEKGLFDAVDLFKKIIPMCEALRQVHKCGLVHRDISPDNIMMMEDGSLKLMDFGSARDVNFKDKKSLSIMLKPGYAPEEQYRTKGLQGPWTDIYAICATLYKCITGVAPDESMERVFSDELKRPSELGVNIPEPLEDVMMKGLAIYQKDRYQNIDEFLSGITEYISNNAANTSSNSEAYNDNKLDEEDKTEKIEEDVPKAPKALPVEEVKEEVPEAPEAPPVEEVKEEVPETPEEPPVEEVKEEVPEAPEAPPVEEVEEEVPEAPEAPPVEEVEEEVPDTPEAPSIKEVKEEAPEPSKSSEEKISAVEEEKQEQVNGSENAVESQPSEQEDSIIKETAGSSIFKDSKKDIKEQSKQLNDNSKKSDTKEKKKYALIGVIITAIIVLLIFIITQCSGSKQINVIGKSKDEAVSILNENNIIWETVPYDAGADEGYFEGEVVEQYYYDENDGQTSIEDENYNFDPFKYTLYIKYAVTT